MQLFLFEELLRLLVRQCDKNPDLFVAFFNQSNFLIGYNYRCSLSAFTHVSSSFQKVLGYDQNNILCNGNFVSNIIHPHDKLFLKEYLNNFPDSYDSFIPFSNQYIVNRTKCRARHIRGYWKYFLIFSVNFWNSQANTFDKIGLIADERAKPNLQVISRNRDRLHINTLISDSNSNESNGHGFIISPRESEILEFISDGMIAKEIATKLNICLSTVITHRKNLILKFHVHNTAELMKKATKLMLI